MKINNAAPSIASTAVIAVTSFVLGIALSFLYVHATYEVCDGDPDDDHNDDTNNLELTGDAAAEPTNQSEAIPSEPKIYDSPDLDIRLLRKAEAVIQKRTDKMIVVVERCTNDHNYSAILRTAEALGIQTICLIDPPAPTTINDDGTVRVVDPGEMVDYENDVKDDDDNNKQSNNHVESNGGMTQPTYQQSTQTAQQKVIRLSENERKAFMDHRKFAQNATQWLTIREFTNAAECIHTLRTVEKYQIWVTDLSQEAIPLTKFDLQQYHNTYHNNNNTTRCKCWPLPERIAIVMGTEAVGCSVEMLQSADVRCYLPLYGFADSLNLSVATALVIQQILHLNPNYIANMSSENRHLLRTMWYPKLAQQRLMSARTKKQYRAVQKQIETCQRLQMRYDAGEVLTAEQIMKMQRIQEHEQTLYDIENSCENYTTANRIVQEYIDHPPVPLSDLRRANIHRVTFVGKNIKKKHIHHWKDMVAISNIVLPKMTTASFFRNRRTGTVDES
jgi:tRNA G18 (ribose-2'-O)-methylase SpoU